MAKKKLIFEKEAVKRVLELDTGEIFEVVSEDGKYYRCGNTQFRKSNPHILSVRFEIAGHGKDEKEDEGNADHE